MALALNLALADRPFYRALLWLQLAGYAVAAAGLLLRRHVSLIGPLRLPLLVFALNLAFLLGFWRYISGGASGLWHRTER
jgi:hypothetical protein